MHQTGGRFRPEDADMDGAPRAAVLPDPPDEQKLLWGDSGGVVLITGILVTVVVVLTLTVGALPL